MPLKPKKLENKIKREKKMDNILKYYNQFDELGRLEREPVEFQVNWHYMKKYLRESATILDNGAGPGKYSIAFAKEGYKVALTDITPRLVEIAEKKAKELGVAKKFLGFYIADACNLSMLDDEQFDASLMLGPMYHLQKEKDRIKAVKELNRVTKKGGIVFVAFMPRIRHILTSLLYPESWKPNNRIDRILQFSESGCFNHSDEGRFTGAYYFEIDDINPFMESHGFETKELIGSNMGAMLNEHNWDYWKERGEADKVIQLIKERASDPYTLGVSSHLLYIGRKK